MSKDWLVKSIEMAFQRNKGLWADSLLDVLEGLTPEQAMWKPEGKDIHSIEEIVNHIISGEQFIVSALGGEKPSYEENAEESMSWKDTVRKLEDVHNRLTSLLKEKDINLDDRIPGEDSPWGEMLFGVLAHCCYHTGQIIILKALQGL
ncbi:MAG: DinB family protein [Dictyoglomi bacterium]|nr:DinB family protein [Dictyoglomota bacterium]HHV80209.1 DinB family protein [bacterium]